MSKVPEVSSVNFLDIPRCSETARFLVLSYRFYNILCLPGTASVLSWIPKENYALLRLTGWVLGRPYPIWALYSHLLAHAHLGNYSPSLGWPTVSWRLGSRCLRSSAVAWAKAQTYFCSSSMRVEERKRYLGCPRWDSKTVKGTEIPGYVWWGQ